MDKEFHGLSEISGYTEMNGEEEEEDEAGGIYSVETGEEILKSAVIQREEVLHEGGEHKPMVGSEEWHRIRRSSHKV